MSLIRTLCSIFIVRDTDGCETTRILTGTRKGLSNVRPILFLWKVNLCMWLINGLLYSVLEFLLVFQYTSTYKQKILIPVPLPRMNFKEREKSALKWIKIQF